MGAAQDVVSGAAETLESVANAYTGDDKATVQRIVQQTSGKVVRTFPFLIGKDGELTLRDQHLDIYSRWFFPVAYLFAILVLFATMSDEQAPPPWASDYSV